MRSKLLTRALRPRFANYSLRDIAKAMRTYRRGYGLGGLMRRRKRRAFGRRRLYKKKTQNKIHTYVRWADKDALYPGASGPNNIVETGNDQNLAYTFKLDNVVNVADFVNLYDSYRINKVVLHLEPYSNQTGIPVTFPQNLKIRVVHDYNDANPLTQEDDYLEYANCKSYNSVSGRTIRITLYPKINNTIENVNGSAGYISNNSNRIWLNTADDEVPHFGLKIFIPANIQQTNFPLFKVRAKFWLSMKNSK